MGLLARLRAAGKAFMGTPVPGEISQAGAEPPGRVTGDSETAVTEREIDVSEELTPERIREYFILVGKQFEGYYEDVKRGLRKVQVVLERMNGDIGELQAKGPEQAETVSRMQSERDRLRGAALKLESRIEEHRERLDTLGDEAPDWLFLNDPEVYHDVDELWRALRDILNLTEGDHVSVDDTSGLETYFRDVFPVWKGALPLWKRPEPDETGSPGEEVQRETSPNSGARRRTKPSGTDPYQQLTQELIDALRMTTKPGEKKPEDEGN